MDKEHRKQLLKRFAASSEAIALKEYLEELIVGLTDSRTYKSDDFEMEGKAALKAVGILERILRDLKLLKREKKEKGRTQYT